MSESVAPCFECGSVRWLRDVPWGDKSTTQRWVCENVKCKKYWRAPLPNDAVDHPQHYKAGNMEAIDVIEALGHGHGFCVGNAIKYLWRAGKKQPDALQDLKKAQWYVARAIEAIERGK